jgi:hypothetical protein
MLNVITYVYPPPPLVKGALRAHCKILDFRSGLAGLDEQAQV